MKQPSALVPADPVVCATPAGRGSSPGAKAPGSFLTAGPQAGQPTGLGVPGRGLMPSAAGVRVAGPAPTQQITFNTPPQRPGLAGCTGVARVGICIRCDRLYQRGDHIAPAAVRPRGGVYVCANQVIDGVHVTSVPPVQGVDQSQHVGGVNAAIPATEGVRA